MALVNKLLENIYFGTELEKLAEGTRWDIERLSELLDAPELPKKHKRIIEMCSNFARNRNAGRFGGQITPGDMAFIVAFMAALKPEIMIELGVCSGQSSAAILVAAHRLSLYRDDDGVFLHSFDLVETFEGPDNVVGQVVTKNYEGRAKHWSLFTKQTAENLIDPDHPTRRAIKDKKPVLAFVDAEHCHPEPLMDVLILTKVLPRGSWILLQDIRLMERWLANTVERGVVCPRPQRGVEHVMAHWPGPKITGQGSCFNMGAISTDIDHAVLDEFSKVCLQYAPELEIDDDRIQRVLQFTKAL